MVSTLVIFATVGSWGWEGHDSMSKGFDQSCAKEPAFVTGLPHFFVTSYIFKARLRFVKQRFLDLRTSQT